MNVEGSQTIRADLGQFRTKDIAFDTGQSTFQVALATRTQTVGLLQFSAKIN